MARPTAAAVITDLQKYANPEDALFLGRFFKTAPGQYGEGDVFIGIRVPQTRAICKQCKGLPLPEIQKLLHSKVHEHRLAGVIILTYQYPKATEPLKKAIYDFYLHNVYSGRINNWDIVDSSADRIVGAHLLHRPRDILFDLAQSDNLWQRRVSIIATFWFLKHGDASTTLRIAEKLLHDPQDLIQKAVGWMLRETGKKVGRQLLLDFLNTHAATMPRTMLRYAIEHLNPDQKLFYMQLKNKKHNT